MRIAIVWALLIALAGCSEQSPPATTEATPAKAPAPAPVRDEPSEVQMVASMEEHYSVVILAHDALLQGDVDAFKSQLALVPDNELPLYSPDHWLPLHEKLKKAAANAAHVTDLDSAATTLSGVVLACGQCHSALSRGPVYPAPAPDDGDTSLQTAMLDHQWATERLWEGVTGPWDNAWERGAAAMAVIEVFGQTGPELVLSEELLRREIELREIGVEAGTTVAPNERAALYGRLLATCGDCHQLVGVTFEAPE